MAKEDDKTEYRQLRDTIYTFMYYSNKPMIGTEICLQFKNQKKSMIEKVLEDLVAKDMIFMKLFGKSKIYCLSQNMEFKIDESIYNDEIDATQDQTIEDKCLRYLKWNFERHNEELIMLKEENKMLTNEIASNENQLTVDELKRSINDMKTIIKEYEAVKDENVVISYDDFNNVKKKHGKIKKELANRNLIFNNIVDNISEGLEMNKKKFLKDVGIE